MVILQVLPCLSGRRLRSTVKTAKNPEQDPFDAAVVGVFDVLARPVFAEQVPRQFDDDVIGSGAGVVIVARKTLQAGRARGQVLTP